MFRRRPLRSLLLVLLCAFFVTLSGGASAAEAQPVSPAPTAETARPGLPAGADCGIMAQYGIRDCSPSPTGVERHECDVMAASGLRQLCENPEFQQRVDQSRQERLERPLDGRCDQVTNNAARFACGAANAAVGAVVGNEDMAREGDAVATQAVAEPVLDAAGNVAMSALDGLSLAMGQATSWTLTYLVELRRHDGFSIMSETWFKEGRWKMLKLAAIALMFLVPYAMAISALKGDRERMKALFVAMFAALVGSVVLVFAVLGLIAFGQAVESSLVWAAGQDPETFLTQAAAYFQSEQADTPAIMRMVFAALVLFAILVIVVEVLASWIVVPLALFWSPLICAALVFKGSARDVKRIFYGSFGLLVGVPVGIGALAFTLMLQQMARGNGNDLQSMFMLAVTAAIASAIPLLFAKKLAPALVQNVRQAYSAGVASGRHAGRMAVSVRTGVGQVQRSIHQYRAKHAARRPSSAPSRPEPVRPEAPTASSRPEPHRAAQGRVERPTSRPSRSRGSGAKVGSPSRDTARASGRLTRKAQSRARRNPGSQEE